MTEIQSRLYEFAVSRCLPYLFDLPRLQPYLEQLSFILVGSVATGLCREDSDIDIAIVCDEEFYGVISKDTRWDAGRPTEIMMDGVWLHYYAITFEKIEGRLRELDDVYMYVYSNAIVLRDPQNRYTQRLSKLSSHMPEVRKQQIEGKLDMLLRRSRALGHCLGEGDPLTTGRVCLEIISLCLKIIALLDDVSFDPRKRLFKTAMRGKMGQQMEGVIRQLFSSLGALGSSESGSHFADFVFPDKLNEIVDILSHEAKRQGFQVGLERPDRRHIMER
jgi:predicted nucleotidyltransferase